MFLIQISNNHELTLHKTFDLKAPPTSISLIDSEKFIVGTSEEKLILLNIENESLDFIEKPPQFVTSIKSLASSQIEGELRN